MFDAHVLQPEGIIISQVRGGFGRSDGLRDWALGAGGFGSCVICGYICCCCSNG